MALSMDVVTLELGLYDSTLDHGRSSSDVLRRS